MASASIINLQAQDWANLGKYQAANRDLGIPAGGENRVVFMGNSITEQWSSFTPNFFTKKEHINRGISGQTTPQMLVRFRQDVIHLQPKVVVILAGTNDLAGNTGPSTVAVIYDNIVSMVEIAQVNNIKVVLSSVLPVYDYPWNSDLEPSGKIIELNALLKQYASLNNCIYLDYFSAMVDERNGLDSKYTNDEVHPTRKGYKVMIPLAEEAILKALKLE